MAFFKVVPYEIISKYNEINFTKDDIQAVKQHLQEDLLNAGSTSLEDVILLCKMCTNPTMKESDFHILSAIVFLLFLLDDMLGHPDELLTLKTLTAVLNDDWQSNDIIYKCIHLSEKYFDKTVHRMLFKRHFISTLSFVLALPRNSEQKNRHIRCFDSYSYLFTLLLDPTAFAKHDGLPLADIMMNTTLFINNLYSTKDELFKDYKTSSTIMTDCLKKGVVQYKTDPMIQYYQLGVMFWFFKIDRYFVMNENDIKISCKDVWKHTLIVTRMENNKKCRDSQVPRF